jgi:hypothetical protein
LKITRTDPFTGQENTLDLKVTPTQMARWQAGALAQSVFTFLNADEREFIISGIPPGKWDDYLGDEPMESLEDMQ